MYINRNIEAFKIFEQSSLLDALRQLTEKRSKILFVVDARERVVGALADGDIRRFLINGSDSLSSRVIEAANKDYSYIYSDEPVAYGYNLLSTKVQNVPIIDREGTLTGVIINDEPIIEIAGRKIGSREPVFIIAEIGNNHNGSLARAKELVNLAVEAGADCVKFQMRDLKSLYNNQGDGDDNAQDLGSQYVLDLLKRFQLSDDDFAELFAYCHDKDILALCTPFDLESADKLEKLGVAAFKVASADLTNHKLLQHLAQKKRPLIVSTGMAYESEIIDVVDLLEKEGATFALLHCNSTYPAPFKDVNLNYIKRLKTLGKTVVGYSGHERGYAVPVASIPLGAKIIEKHFTLDKNMEGNDHKVSLLPEEFTSMVQAIRAVEAALGSAEISKTITQGELINRETLAKSIVAKVDIKKGDLFTEDMLCIKSPGKGLPPYKIHKLLNKVAVRDICQNDFLYQSDVDGEVIVPKHYSLPLKFGIPVRYHDFARMCEGADLKMVEFHLSYKDLNVNIHDYLRGSYDLDVAIHAPELFENDHVLNLCAESEDYRQQSIRHLQRVIDMARDVKAFFRNKGSRVCIVVNCGGFTSNGFVDDPVLKEKMYQQISDAFKALDTEGVELIPQTMPPFPWHFGGQQYHNLFVEQDEIIAFCQKHSMRICYDLSHTALACNYYGWDLYQFTKNIAKYSAHHHISDAKGADGEGLQIGDGDIDFQQVFDALTTEAPDTSWIPEIWQGHKNNGEGFWKSFEALDALLS